MKGLTGFAVCLLFTVNAFAQEDTDAAPAVEPANSVIDENLTLAIQQDQDINDLAIDSAEATAIPSTVSRPKGCECRQTSYQPLPRLVAAPYTYRVPTGMSFNRIPMRRYQAFQTYRIPPASPESALTPQPDVPRYEQYYYAPPQPILPLRRGFLLNRFRR